MSSKLNCIENAQNQFGPKEVRKLLEKDDGFALVADELDKIQTPLLDEEVSRIIDDAAAERFENLKAAEVDVRIKEISDALSSLVKFD